MKNLTTGNIYKNFILFAIPLVLAGFLSQSFNLINNMLAGKFLGDTGLAATGATAGFITFYSSIFWGYGTGFSIHLAKLFGEMNYKKIKSSIYNNCLLLFVVMSITNIAIIIFRNQIFDILKVDPEIRNEAIKYFVILIFPYYLSIFRQWGIVIANAFGMSSVPLYISFGSSVLETALKVIALSVLKTGIVSIAVITHIVSVLIVIAYIIMIKRIFKEMKVEKEKVRFDFGLIKETFSLAVPNSVQQMIMYTVTLLISPMVNSIGSSASAAYSVVANIQSISCEVYQNSSKTVANYSDQCMGMRKFGNLKKGLRVGFLQGMLFLAPVLIGCVILGEPLCRLYFPSGYNGESLDLCILFVRCYLPFLFFNVINNLFHSFYKGVMAMKTLLASAVIGAVARISATAFFVSSMGMEGVYIGWAVSWITEAIYHIVIYFTDVWKKEKVNKIIEKEGIKL